MPMIGLGCYQLGTSRELTSREIILTALYTGYRLFDLAFRYQADDDFRLALHESGLDRDQIFIVHKIWNVDFEIKTAYQETLTQFQQILQNLQTKYIDLLLLHMPQNNSLVCWQVLETLYEQGSVRAIGVCNFNLVQMKNFCAQVKIKPMVLQTQVSPWVFQCQRDVIDYCHTNHIAVMGWGTMGRGSYSCLKTPLILELARQHHTEPAHIVLQWLLQKNVIIIPSSRKPVRIKSNWNQINQLRLSPTESRAIDDLPQRELYLYNVSSVRDKIDFINPSWDG